MKRRLVELIIPVFLLIVGQPARAETCTVHRDDDDGRESEATMDYSDDFMEKTITLAGGPGDAAYARVWIYGQPYNYVGYEFEERVDYFIRVNGDPQQELWFDVGLAFEHRDDIYQWKSFVIPVSWLVSGDNTFYIGEDTADNVLERWTTNNLRVGVDENTDLDLSWWWGNGVTTCFQNPSGCTGELMIYIELCTLPSTPAVSEWGLAAMTLLVLTAGTVLLARRRIA